MKTEKSKSTPKKYSNVSKWLTLAVIIILIGIGTTAYKNHNKQTNFPKENTNSTEKTQKPTLTQHVNNKISDKKATLNTEKSIKSLFELDKISQSILYTRISYLEIIAQHNINAAIQWLNLSFELIKQAQTENGSAILEEITKLKESIKNQQEPNIQQILQDLNSLKESLNKLTIDSGTKAENNSITETEESAENHTLWESLLNFCKTQLKNLSTWAKTSISVEHISNDHYNTLQSTLSKELFQTETNKLIEQAQLAAQFKDTEMFQYTCKKIESLVTFYIQEPNKKQSLLKQLNDISNMPVTIVAPDYSVLLTLLNQNTANQSSPLEKISTDIPDTSSENIKLKPDTKSTSTTEPKNKTPKPKTSELPIQEKPHSLNIQEITT